MLQHDPRHVDGALVVWDHAGHEVWIGVSRIGDRHVAVHHRARRHEGGGRRGPRCGPGGRGAGVMLVSRSRRLGSTPRRYLSSTTSRRLRARHHSLPHAGRLAHHARPRLRRGALSNSEVRRSHGGQADSKGKSGSKAGHGRVFFGSSPASARKLGITGRAG